MSNLNNLKVYFFSGSHYIRVTRGETGAGSIDPGYNPPQPISNWQWPHFPDGTAFGADGIDAALYSGYKCYFFKGPWYVRVTRNGTTGPGQQDFTSPQPISQWGWPPLSDGTIFGASGIDAALWSGPVCYFFSGNQYIRVTRGDDDFGKTDPQYPRSINAGWGWSPPFANGIKGALPSGLKCYFFSGIEYIRVSRGLELGGFIDPGYPGKITAWNWPAGFGENGIDAALYSGGLLEPQPTGGLISNWNYFLGDGGNNLDGVSVTINIDNDFASNANGFGFQLNTFSKYIPGTTKAVAQQLIIYSDANTNDLYSWIYIYSGSFEDNTANAGFISIEKPLGVTLPATNTIKSGSSLNFTPLIDKSSSNLLGCTFTYTPAGGSPVSNQLLITDGVTNTTKQKATTAELSPIVTFTMNVVAEYNEQVANFGEGQGTISYSASTQAGPQLLTATAYNPSYSNFGGSGVHTVESANIIYAGLPGNRPVDVSQLFGITPSVPVDADIVAAKPSSEGMGLPLPPHLLVNQEDREAKTGLRLPLPPHLSGGTCFSKSLYRD